MARSRRKGGRRPNGQFAKGYRWSGGKRGRLVKGKKARTTKGRRRRRR